MYVCKQNVQNVQLKSGPYFNISNLFTKIYNMLYYTTDLVIAISIPCSIPGVNTDFC